MDKYTTRSESATRLLARKAALAACIAAILAACQGCMAIQSGVHFLSLQPQYTRHGFAVRDGQRTYKYDSKKNLSVLELRGALVLEDFESDGKVDTIKAGDFSYLRDEPGTEALFGDADRAFGQFLEYLSIGHFRKKWSELDPSGIVENRLDRPYAR